MSASDRRGSRAKSDQEMAAYMKKMGIQRTTGACPWGCGARLRNGGEHLITHLNVCHGPSRGR